MTVCLVALGVAAAVCPTCPPAQVAAVAEPGLAEHPGVGAARWEIWWM